MFSPSLDPWTKPTTNEGNVPVEPGEVGIQFPGNGKRRSKNFKPQLFSKVLKKASDTFLVVQTISWRHLLLPQGIWYCEKEWMSINYFSFVVSLAVHHRGYFILLELVKTMADLICLVYFIFFKEVLVILYVLVTAVCREWIELSLSNKQINI